MYRYCKSGTECDMFEFEPATSTCRYFPHIGIKSEGRLVDIIQPIDDMHQNVSQINFDTYLSKGFFQNPPTIYILECSDGASVNIAKGSNLITKNLDNDWTGKSNYIFY